MPKASIIITTHNRPRLLLRAVASARGAGKEIEIIVVDDGSVDETAKLCRGLDNIKYIRLGRTQQVAGARNVGMLVSRGEYLSFLDDDDVRLPGSLDKQLEILERTPHAMLIYGQALIEDCYGGERRRYPLSCPIGDVFWQLLPRNFIPCGSVVFRRRCLSTIGMLDDRIAGLDDWDFWIRISEIFPVIGIDSPVMIWRRPTPVSGQGSSQAAGLVAKGIRQFRDVWMSLPRAARASRTIKQIAWQNFSENMAEHLICEAGRSLRYCELRQPLLNLAVILRLYPLTMVRIIGHRFFRIPRPQIHESRTVFPFDAGGL